MKTETAELAKPKKQQQQVPSLLLPLGGVSAFHFTKRERAHKRLDSAAGVRSVAQQTQAHRAPV